MPSYDLSTYLEDDALVLKGVVSKKHPRGKAYTIASPDAALGLRLQHIMATRAARGVDRPPTAEEIEDMAALIVGDDGAPVSLHVRLMGDAYQQMIDDGVSADRLDMITSLVVTHYGHGSHVARAIIEAATEGNREARENRASRRAAKKPTAKKTAGSRSRRASGATTGSGRATRSSTSGSSTSANAPEAKQAV